MFRQFHIEGFVTTYTSGGGSAPAVVFNSENLENLPAGCHARETYRMTGEDSIVEVFELAGSGKEFNVYSETHPRRLK
jgi:hypothetical protein